MEEGLQVGRLEAELRVAEERKRAEEAERQVNKLREQLATITSMTPAG